jgi:hypothetical protein
MTLLRELINIPEHVQKGDFVLRLSEGVIDPAGTLGEYVVTPELVKCFDQALDLVRDAVARRTSKATYLHGSFGSGKSHFMAVLHLILEGNAQARGIPELAPVIAKHAGWLVGKKFLLVPYHMIGAHSMESGILGGYVLFIRRKHPKAPTPVWAGYDHLQLAKAVAAHYVHVQEQEGGRDDPRLVPLLACLIELLPWLKQWYNEVDPEYGVAMGDYYEGFVSEEARQMGRTIDEVRAWQPDRKTSRKAAKTQRKKESR